jgi:hypothetical protein
MKTHENVSSFRKVVLGSNRKFGLTFGAVFAFFGLWPLIHHFHPRWAFLAAAVIIAAIAFVQPERLTPLNNAWFKLGMLLNRIVNPIVMGLMFFAAVTPLGWFIRMRGGDLLSLKMKPGAATYWTVRETAPPAPGAMTKQF